MQHSSQLWRKANLIALFLTLIIGLATFAVGKRILFPVTVQQVTTGAATPTAATPKEVDVIVPEGMPLSFTAATEEDNEKGHEIKTSLVSKHANKINSLTYVTYEFDPTGNLVRVEGGIKRLDLEAGKSAGISIVPQRRSNAKNRLMIALEKVTTDKDSWSASPLDLAIAGANKAKGKSSPLPAKKIKRKSRKISLPGFVSMGIGARYNWQKSEKRRRPLPLRAISRNGPMRSPSEANP